jgi:hypothetical protein
VTINIEMIAMVVSILALMCSGFHLLVFSFPLLVPLLRLMDENSAYYKFNDVGMIDST